MSRRRRFTAELRRHRIQKNLKEVTISTRRPLQQKIQRALVARMSAVLLFVLSRAFISTLVPATIPVARSSCARRAASSVSCGMPMASLSPKSSPQNIRRISRPASWQQSSGVMDGSRRACQSSSSRMSTRSSRTRERNARLQGDGWRSQEGDGHDQGSGQGS